MAYEFISNSDATQSSDAALQKAVVHEAALYEADAALYGSLQAWRNPAANPADTTEDNEEPLPNLSRALLGDDRLQALIITDYLANLSPSEFANVADTLANDTLSQLVSLAQHYDPLEVVAVDPLEACQPVIEPKHSSNHSTGNAAYNAEPFEWVDYIESDHYHP